MTPPLLSRVEGLLKGTAETGTGDCVLLVTPFAPYRDGISVYAQEELRSLRRAGRRVEVLSPVPSAAHHHLPLGGPRGAALLAARASRYDTVIVQVAPELLFGRCRTAAERALVWSALASMATQTQLDLRLHEVIYDWLSRSPVERNAARLAIKAAHRVTVHTEVEKSALVAELGTAANRIEVIEHGACFNRRVDISRAEAKASLGLSPDEFVMLCIGFLQHSKGFDRAVEAVAAARRRSLDQSTPLRPRFHLHVVGAARVKSPEIETYVDELRAMCDTCPDATLHERFVSDLEFDTWVAAADAVFVPYRQIWSSGVVERARLYGAPLIASDLPQLADQLPDDGLVCDSIDQMADAVLELLDRRQAGATPLVAAPTEQIQDVNTSVDSAWIVDDEQPDRDLIQKQVQLRADLRRGHAPSRPVGYRRPGSGSPVDELSSLDGVPRPEAASARPGVSQVKSAVQRLTAWQVDPIARHVDELQAVIVDTVLDLEARMGTTSVDASMTDGAKDQPDAGNPISLIEAATELMPIDSGGTDGDLGLAPGGNGVDTTTEGAR